MPVCEGCCAFELTLEQEVINFQYVGLYMHEF